SSLGSVSRTWDNTCEIYDPVADTWTTFASPADAKGVTWAHIGDAPCAVLPDGTFLLGSDFDSNIAKLDPGTLTWTAMSQRPPAFVSEVTSDEDSWVLMPDNTVVAPSCEAPPTTWIYSVTNDHWEQGNRLMNSIVDASDDEIGPGLLRYDGTAFFLGANQHTAMYTPGANPAWTNGPDLPAQTLNGQPVQLGIEDGPASMMVNGNILFGAGGVAKDETGQPQSSPSWFFEYDGSTFNRTNDPPNNNTYTYTTRLLPLPNGDVLFCQSVDSSFYAYHSDARFPMTAIGQSSRSALPRFKREIPSRSRECNSMGFHRPPATATTPPRRRIIRWCGSSTTRRTTCGIAARMTTQRLTATATPKPPWVLRPAPRWSPPMSTFRVILSYAIRCCMWSP